MISQKQLKYFSSLSTKKFRHQENKFIVEGKRIVAEGLNSNFKCEAVFMTENYVEKNSELLDLIKNTKTYVLNSKEFKKISETKTPQGIAAVFHSPEIKFDTLMPFNDSLIVLLDNISDPGNVGTIIRNCDWFGIKTILFGNNTVEYANPKVLRSSMGSIFHLNIIEMKDFDTLHKFKKAGYEILCADKVGDNIFNYKNNNKRLIIFSNEAHGPSHDLSDYIDKRITIPRIGKAESLNVAAASAVILAKLTKK